MARLSIYYEVYQRTESTVTVEVSGITTMGYAAPRVAEALGEDPYDAPWRLLRIDGMAIDPQELARDWDGKDVVLCGHKESFR